MANETPMTLVGRLVADPELRYTQSGTAVAGFRVATNPRRFNAQANQWEDGDASFWPCNIWRAKAEAVANTLHKGDLVILVGTVAQRSWESKEGEKRSQMEITVDNIGPVILPPRRDSGGGQSSGGWNTTPQGKPSSYDDEPPW